jgi:hypothetical protein
MNVNQTPNLSAVALVGTVSAWPSSVMATLVPIAGVLVEGADTQGNPAMQSV